MKRAAAKSNLGEALRSYRVLNDLTLRELAARIGISAATLMRLEHGRMPEGETFVLLLNWMVARR